MVKEWSESPSLRGRGNNSIYYSLVAQPHYGCGSKVNLQEAKSRWRLPISTKCSRTSSCTFPCGRRLIYPTTSWCFWTLAPYFFSNAVQICDCLKTFLSRVNRKCVYELYKNCVKEFIISFLPSKSKLMCLIMALSQYPWQLKL